MKKPVFSHKFVTNILGGRYIPKRGDYFWRTCDMNKPGWKPQVWDTVLECVGFDGLFVDGMNTKTGKVTRFSVLYTFRRTISSGDRVTVS